MPREMKDSGVEWIGEIPEGWEICRIKNQIANNGKDIAVGPFGSLLKKIVVDDGNINVYGQANLVKNNFDQTKNHITLSSYEAYPQYHLLPGDIVVSMMGTIGKCKIVPNNISRGIIDSHLIRFRLDKSFNNRYFEYVYDKDLCDVVFNQLKYLCKGTIMDGLNISLVSNVEVPFPPLNEQIKIISYLDTRCSKIDEAITQLNELITEEKEYKKALIAQAVTKGLDPDVEMKNSGVKWVGEIPKSWSVGKIKHLLDKESEYPIGDGDHGMIKNSDYVEEGIPYLRVLNLTWGNDLNLSTLVYISEKSNNKIKSSILKPNDILIAKTGATIGKTGMVPSSIPVSNTTSHVGKITINKIDIPRYFFYVLTSSIVQDKLKEMSEMQSTRPELGIEGMKQLLVTIPPIEERKKIVDYLDSKCLKINHTINEQEALIEELKSYKKSLIFEYVTGKKEVPSDD